MPLFASQPLSDAEINERVRQLQASRDARVGVYRAQVRVDPSTPPPPAKLEDELAKALQTQLTLLKEIRNLAAETLRTTEQNFGRLDDEMVWLPFNVTISDGAQTAVSAVVDQDSIFYYVGYGVVHFAGTSYVEIIDGDASSEHFAPAASESASDTAQYGTKGKRVYTRVSVLIKNATGASRTYNGFFKGRFRKGGR